MPINVLELWDFSNPSLSEERFLDAMSGANPDEILILKTQVARTYGLRKDFEKARSILAAVEGENGSNEEVRARYWLELGRCLSSVTHGADSQTVEAKEEALAAYTKAFEIANAAKLDYLAIDALHMKAIADPERDIFWTTMALEYLESSEQAEAKKWEGSLRNNLGYALYQAGKLEMALMQFEKALALREGSGTPTQVRVAKWMVAWTLRTLGRLDEALAMQLELESEWDVEGKPSPYVFEELEHIYRALGDEENAGSYRNKRSALDAKHL